MLLTFFPLSDEVEGGVESLQCPSFVFRLLDKAFTSDEVLISELEIEIRRCLDAMASLFANVRSFIL